AAAPLGEPDPLQVVELEDDHRGNPRQHLGSRQDLHPSTFSDGGRAKQWADRPISAGPTGLGRSHAADREAPGAAALEELVYVHLVRPAEEVRLGVVIRGAVDGRTLFRRPLCVQRLAALERVEARLRLLRDGAFLVTSRHEVECTLDAVPAALAVRGLAKRYGPIEALRGVDLEVKEGELVGLLGPNGAGKSTLVKIACGLVRASAGDPVGRRTVRTLLEALRRRGISVLLNSHLLSEVELVCDRVVILLGGKVVAAGAPAELARARGIELETDRGKRVVEGIRDDVPRIVAEAVAAGEQVYGVRVLTSTLEDVYLEAVG